MLWQVEEPELIGQILDAEFDGLFVLFVHFKDLDEQVNILALLLLRHLLQRCEQRDVDLHVIGEVDTGPLAQRLQRHFVHAHIERVILARILIGVVIAEANATLAIFTVLVIAHLHVTRRVIA